MLRINATTFYNIANILLHDINKTGRNNWNQK